MIVAHLAALSVAVCAPVEAVASGKQAEDRVQDGFYLVLDDADEITAEIATIADDLAGSPPLMINRQPIVSVSEVARASVILDDAGVLVCIVFELTDAGGAQMRAVTSKNVGRRMAIVVDAVAVSVPVIQAPVAERVQVCGDWTFEQATPIAFRFGYKGRNTP